MPVFKYFAVVGSALLVLLLICDAYFGEVESRYDGSLYQSALYAPRPNEIDAIRVPHFTRDVTPASRVKDVFAQFVPNEGRRGKR